MLPFAIAPLAHKLTGHDVVIVLGAPVFRYYPYSPGLYVPEGTQLVQITDDPAEVERAPVGEGVVGDILLAANELLTQVPQVERQAPPTRSIPAVPQMKTPLSPSSVYHALAAALPEKSVIVEESPLSLAALHEQVPIRHSGGYYTAASGGLGWALPASVGIQLAQPTRRVVCVIGDGSTMYSIQAFWSAVQHQAPIVVVTLRNREYAILKSFGTFEKDASPLPGLDLPGFDLVPIAQGLGCEAHRVEQPEELTTLVQRAFQSQQSVLLEGVIDSTVPPLL